MADLIMKIDQMLTNFQCTDNKIVKVFLTAKRGHNIHFP